MINSLIKNHLEIALCGFFFNLIFFYFQIGCVLTNKEICGEKKLAAKNIRGEELIIFFYHEMSPRQHFKNKQKTE